MEKKPFIRFTKIPWEPVFPVLRDSIDTPLRVGPGIGQALRRGLLLIYLSTSLRNVSIPEARWIVLFAEDYIFSNRFHLAYDAVKFAHRYANRQRMKSLQVDRWENAQRVAIRFTHEDLCEDLIQATWTEKRIIE